MRNVTNEEIYFNTVGVSKTRLCKCRANRCVSDAIMRDKIRLIVVCTVDSLGFFSLRGVRKEVSRSSLLMIFLTSFRHRVVTNSFLKC